MDLKKIVFISLSVFIGKQAIAQSDYSYYAIDKTIHPGDTNQLFLQIDNNNFFLNNEYGGDIVKGYTLLGFNFAPQLIYSPNPRLKLSGGANLLSYYGREEESDLSLLLSFQYNLHRNLDFILGSIYGTVNHEMIEPLFDFERFYLERVENGIQFLWNSERLKADLWLDWEYQIFHKDPFKERFNVGLSARYDLISNDNYAIQIPFQNLIRHEGGQINNNNEPVVTIYNNAIGLAFNKIIRTKIVNSISLSSYWLNYQDLSSTKEQMFIDGMGSYTTLEFKHSDYDLLLGYWYGHQHIAPIGNPVYETYSRTNIFVEEPIRQLISGKFNYHKTVSNGINLGARLGAYYDLLNSNMDYYWSVAVVINEKILIKNNN